MPEGQDATAPPATPPDGESTPAGDLGISVALDQFSGPMDLLLYLVRRAEVDIKDLPVLEIAEQFAEWVSKAAGSLDLEAAGDFVVMAATLLEIKARMVAPPPEGTEVPDDGEDEFDPRAGLIRKLLIYRAAKEAAFELDQREDRRRLLHHRGHKEVVPDDDAEIDAWELKDVSAGTLANLWFDLLKRIDGLGPRTVLVDDVPMGVRMSQVVEDMRNRGEGRLSELFAIDSGPVARASIVMAVLECTRQRLLRVSQAEQYGDVLIRFRHEGDRAITTGDPGPPELLPKRQRRPPLVTWQGGPQTAGDDDGSDDEPPPENEEQRFLRELESTVGVERLLSRAADLEKGFIDWWEETHPGEPLPPGVVKPEPPPPPPPPPPPVVEAKPEAPAKPKRQPKPAAAAEPAAATAPPEPAAAVVPSAAEPVAVVPATPDPAPAAAAPPAADPQPSAAAPTVPDPAPTAVAPPDAPAALPATIPDPAPSAAAPPDAPVDMPATIPDPAPTAVAPPDAPVGMPTTIPDPAPSVAAPPDAPVLPATASPPSFEVVPLVDAPAPSPALAEPAPLPEPASEERPSEPEPIEQVVEPAAVIEQPAVTVPPARISEPEPVASEPAPAASVQQPAASEPTPVVSEPAPAASEPAPVVSEPAPAASVQQPAASEPTPVVSEPAPAASVQQPATSEPAPVVSEPAPEPPASSVQRPASSEPAASEPDPVPSEPAPAASVQPSVPVPLPPPQARAPEPPPPPPTPPPPPRAIVQPAPTPKPTLTPTPTQPSKPAPMPLPRHLKLAAMIALWVAITVVLVAWAYHPRQLLTASGPHDAVVARDGELAWTLNLALDPADRAEWPLPTASQPGAFAWRDERTCVFTPSGALPAGAELSVAFPADLRAYGGFRFPEAAVPSFRVRTLPQLTVADPSASLPAFANGSIELALSRVPADPAALLAAVSLTPAVAVEKRIVDGRLRLTGAFAPGVTYALAIAADPAAKADDRPAAWQGSIAMPARTPGARLAAGTGRQAAIEAVNLAWLVVENAAGQRETLRFAAASGDVPARAMLPGHLLTTGENRLRLRWSGGEAEAVVTRHDLPLAPEDGAPALLGGSFPVLSAR